MSGHESHKRCHDGHACIEVTARVDAAHRTIYNEGCREHGEELLAHAQRIAETDRQEDEVHGHRSDGDD
jgi:hypothetical protein